MYGHSRLPIALMAIGLVLLNAFYVVGLVIGPEDGLLAAVSVAAISIANVMLIAGIYYGTQG